MGDDDRGWPLEKEAIRAKYYALVQNDMERKVLKAKSKDLADDHMLQQIPVHLSKSKSTREAYSRARNLQRALRRAGLADTSGKGSRSVPIFSPSSVEPDSGATSSSHRSRVKNDVLSPVEKEDVLALDVNVRNFIKLATPMVNAASNGDRSHGTTKNGKQTKLETKFLAKQFKLISNDVNATPRRNIKILGKHTSPSDEAACGTRVIFVAEKIESDQPQERTRVHDSDKSDSSPSQSVAENSAAQDGSSLRLDLLSRSPGPLMPRKMSSSPRRYIDHAHTNSPSSVISEVVSDVSIPETVMSSVENEELTDCRPKLTSFSFTRERWTSREIFGSFDVGGELDIAGTVAEARNPESSTTTGYYEYDRFNYCLDESLISPRSVMRSPRQSSATSSQGGVTDHDHHYRDRGEHCVVDTRRMKVTSPSSLLRDGPWYNNGNHQRKPCRDQSPPNIPRKLSRKLSTSFNEIPKQGMVQSHPRYADESQHMSLSTRSPDKKTFDKKSPSNASVANENLTVQIAGLVSGFRVSQVTSKISEGGNGKISNGVISQQEAVTAFQDEIAQLMLDRSESNEVADIEEFLDGYMRLRSPFYLEVVEEFFRTVSYDCYRRPLEVKKAPNVPKVPKVIRH